MTTVDITHATLNLCRTNTPAQIRADLDQLANHEVDVAGIQEREEAAARAAFRRFRRSHPEYAGFVPLGAPGAVPIVWRRDTFGRRGLPGFRRTHKGKRGVSPHRYLVWQPLTERATGTRVLVLNTHAVSGYRSDKPDQAYRDAAARRHWLAVARLTARFMNDPTHQVILLGGDFNAPLEDDTEFWYPGPLLSPLYDPSRPPRGTIDQLMFTRDSHAHEVSRTRVPVNSDHPLHLRRLRMGTGVVPLAA